jgi:putative transposase
LTSRLAARFGTIVIEDLHVAAMLRNRRLARRIAGMGWGELRRLLEYKVGRAGGRFVVADRWFPSSKTCSGCGVVKAKLRLSERTFHCDRCGMVLDRDLNAARNLAALAAAAADDTSSHSWWATVNEPDGNPCQSRVTRAAGTATGRPAPDGPGQRRHRKVTAA